jgi:competence protein ComEC
MNIPFKNLKIFIGILLVLNFIFWLQVFLDLSENKQATYFLNVGQGDSQLVRIKKANFLIDAGRDFLVLNNLEKIIPAFKKRIDIAFISHGQLDHAGGMFYVIENYDVGYVIYNGEETSLWQNLKQALDRKKIPYIVLSAPDRVIYGQNKFDILWPKSFDENLKSNDNSMVIRYQNENYSVLFTADITSKTESKLLDKKIASDVLKVAHHGSKYSSSRDFLKAVSPKISIIEVGKNPYGHPTKETLLALKEVGSKIFRTDQDGLIKVEYFKNKLLVSALR